MDTFLLKNTHRQRALAFAVQRITDKQTNPLYAKREALASRILSECWSILREASLDHNGYRDFVAAGVARRIDHIDVGQHASSLFGRYGWHSNIQIWNSVLEQIFKGCLLSFGKVAETTVKQTGEVVSFHGLRCFDRLPEASIRSALGLKPGDDRPDLAPRQDRIRRMIDVDLPAINDEIVDCYGNLPAIADGFLGCRMSEDLFKIFPSARSLFEGQAPNIDSHTQQILASL